MEMVDKVHRVLRVFASFCFVLVFFGLIFISFFFVVFLFCFRRCARNLEASFYQAAGSSVRRSRSVQCIGSTSLCKKQKIML